MNFFVVFVVDVLWTFLVYQFYPKELQEIRSSPTETAVFLPSLKLVARTMFRNKSLLCVTLAYACSNSWTWIWYQIIEVTLYMVGFPLRVGMDIRFWTLVLTCLLAVYVGWLADQLGEYNKRLSLVIQLLAAVILCWVIFVLYCRRFQDYTNLLTVGFIFSFSCSWTTRGLMYELAAHQSHPLPENVAVGVLEMARVSGDICSYFLMAFIPTFHMFWFPVMTAVAGFFSFGVLLFVKQDVCKRYMF